MTTQIDYNLMNPGFQETILKPHLQEVPYRGLIPPDRLQQEELQPSINVGVIGHVSHGKTTVVRLISGVATGKHRKEILKNMTIKLGYANAKIWYCHYCKDYFSTGSGVMTDTCQCPECDGEVELARHISFVDCPGHEVLMAIMLNGATVMDASLVVISADSKCPQPQTKEHLVALNMMGVKNHLLVQNKIDLITPEEAVVNHNQIKEFVANVCPRAMNSPIVPTCANKGLNFGYLCSNLAAFPSPARDLSSSPLMMIVRSFDINKPGEMNIDNLQGGVAGGSLVRGVLELNAEVEIRPGKITRLKDGTFSCHPLKSKVISLASEKNDLQRAFPGGLIGIGTNIDPSIARADGLVGQILGAVGFLPSVYSEIEVSYVLIPRDEQIRDSKENSKDSKENSKDSKENSKDSKENSKDNKSYTQKVGKNENLKLHIGSLDIDAQVVATKADLIRFKFIKYPACIPEKSKVSISRKIGGKGWRLIGVGLFQGGTVILK